MWIIYAISRFMRGRSEAGGLLSQMTSALAKLVISRTKLRISSSASVAAPNRSASRKSSYRSLRALQEWVPNAKKSTRSRK